jgi:hypothetical protein
MTRADGAPRASFEISALDPVARILSPAIATADAHGCLLLAVQTRAFTMASDSSLFCFMLVEQAGRTRRKAARQAFKTTPSVGGQ